MAYPCCRPVDPSDVFGECANSDLNRIKPLDLYADIAIFCLITVIDAFIIVYYRKKAKFDPYALLFMLFLWLAFFASMVGSAISLVYKEDIGHAMKVANYAAYVITRSLFWGLLYIYLFKLHDIYTVQRYGDKGRNYKYRELPGYNVDLLGKMRYNRVFHWFIFFCHVAFSVLSLVGYILPYPDRTYECIANKQKNDVNTWKRIEAYKFVYTLSFIAKFILDCYTYSLFVRMSRYYRIQFRSSNGKYSRKSIVIFFSMYIVFAWNVMVSVILLT